MEIDIVVVAVLGVVTALVCVMLKQYKPEFAMAVGICFSCILLLYLLGRFDGISELFARLSGASGIPNEFFSALIKGLGISLIVTFAADSCTDAGQASLASKIEFAGRLAILYLCLPMINEIIDIVTGLLRG